MDRELPEERAEELANKVCGEDNQFSPFWHIIKDAFLLGYINCLETWKWESKNERDS